MDEILWCDHSDESSLPVLLRDAICFSKYYKMKFGTLVEICLWSHLAVKVLKTDEDILPQRRQILQTFNLHCGGNNLAHTIPASLNFSNFPELYSSLVLEVSLSNLSFTYFKMFFPVVVHVKSWNNHARVYWFVLSTGSWVIVLRQLWNRASHILAFSSMVSVGPEWVR